jgi:hypothetical protein
VVDPRIGGEERLPPEAILAVAPPRLQGIGNDLREVVRATFPEIIERVRPGWHLIGYDLPVPGRRKPVYVAYIAAEPIHVHLGFEHGWAMRDPRGMLQGAGITKQVRWLTFEPGDVIDRAACMDLVREAARVALMTRGERTIQAMDRDLGPGTDVG